MALVAYDNSDVSSGEEDESAVCEPISTPVITKEVCVTDGVIELDVSGKSIVTQETECPEIAKALPKPKRNDVPFVHEDITSRLLFSSLPWLKNSSLSSVSSEKKSAKDAVTLNSSTTLPSNNTVKKIVKITLPSLSNFSDEEEETKPKRLKPSNKGSGLFSLLPAPKNLTVKESNRKLVPRVISKSPALIKVSEPRSNPKRVKSEDLIKYPDSGEDSGEEGDAEVDFFSLAPSTQPEAECSGSSVAASSLCDNPTSNIVENRKIYEVTETPPLSDFSYQAPSNETHTVPQPETPTEEYADNELKLDEDAIHKLCGRRGRKEMDKVQVIDVCGETHLPDPTEWLTKQFTEEQETRSHSHRRKDGPTTQQRRKHQITYLAFQAKEHEIELKNQWANNKMSRKQTQAKYGF